MKKLPLLCILSCVLCIGAAFAYTSEDVSNANYLADQQIVVKQTTASKYRLDDKILRQEVIGMALKMKGVTLPENYTCKKYFADATKNDWVCRAAELAADNGIITRRFELSPKERKSRPADYISRSEALAILFRAANIDNDAGKFSTPGFTRFSDANNWQQSLIWETMQLNIIAPQYSIWKGPEGNERDYHFYPNSNATRGQVFDWATKLVKQRNTKAVIFHAGPNNGGSSYQINLLYPIATERGFIFGTESDRNIFGLYTHNEVDPGGNFLMSIYGELDEAMELVDRYRVGDINFLIYEFIYDGHTYKTYWSQVTNESAFFFVIDYKHLDQEYVFRQMLDSLQNRGKTKEFGGMIPSLDSVSNAFTADFSEGQPIREIMEEKTIYSFGEKYRLGTNAELGWRYPYYITVQNTVSFRQNVVNSMDLFEKIGTWKNYTYYQNTQTGECGFESIIFPGKQYTITVSLGGCGEKDTINDLLGALEDISFDLNSTDNQELLPKGADVLATYYLQLQNWNTTGAYKMRLPVTESLSTFQSWYKNLGTITFREDTLKSLGDNTYEFLVDMTENGVKSTYRVKSKVNLEKFTVDNISSVKQ